MRKKLQMRVQKIIEQEDQEDEEIEQPKKSVKFNKKLKVY